MACLPPSTFDQQDFFHPVDFLKLHFDDFVAVVCTMRPTKRASMGSSRWPRSMSTRAARARAGRVEEGVQGGAHGAAGVKHVVHQDDVFAVDGKGDVRGVSTGGRPWKDRRGRG